MIPCWALALATVAGSCGWSCAGSPLTPTDDGLLGAYADQQASCIADHRGDAGAIDACRKAVQADFDRIQAARFDGGGS